MPYINIDSYPIFISNSRERILLQKLINSPAERARTITDSRAKSQFVDKVEKYLYDLLKNDQSTFMEKWYRIALLEESARTNLYDLLFDYSDFFSNSYLEDLRTKDEKWIDTRNSDNINYPLGNSFFLCIHNGPHSIKNNIKEESIITKILITTSDVNRVSGYLNSLTIEMDNQILDLSNEIIISPKKYY
jgi:hypothetical protein